MATPGPSEGGYDYQFVSDPPKHLECSICLLTLRDAHVTSCCGNHYCQHCIGGVQSENKPCPLCNEHSFTTFLHKGIIREVNSLKIRCPQRELGCDWEGELGQVEQHLNPREGSREQGCRFVLVECVNKCGMRLARMAMQDHMMEECPRRPVEAQMRSLAEHLELMKIEFREELDTMSAESRAKYDALKSENEAIRRENKAIKAQNKTVIAENKTLRAEIKTLKQDIVHLDSRITPVPPFYFNLYNIDYYKKENLVWCSPHFYSHLGGYKMRIVLFPYGSDSGEGTHLSLYVTLRRGEFDDQLKWPFQGKVTVQVCNKQTSKWDHSLTVSFRDASLLYKKRPQQDRCGNPLWGFEDFLAHAHAQYFEHDFIRFRVAKIDL